VVIGLGTVLEFIIIFAFSKFSIFELMSPYSGFVTAVILYSISEIGSKASLICT
jgi:hypothetical protein